jgi:hypothetical protein
VATRKKEKPLWQVGRKTRKPQGPVVHVQGRGGRKLQRELLATARAQRAAAEQQIGTAAPGKSVTARTGAWRFRRHLVPGLWVAVMAMGLAAYQFGIYKWWIYAGSVVVLTWLSTVGTKDTWAARHCLLSALIAAIWSMVLSATGLARPWPAAALASWLVMSWLWLDHYRWRILREVLAAAEPGTIVQDKFAALAQEEVVGRARRQADPRGAWPT